MMNARCVNIVDIPASFLCFYNKNPSVGIKKGENILHCVISIPKRREPRSNFLTFFFEFFRRMPTLEPACNLISSNWKVLGSQSKKATHLSSSLFIYFFDNIGTFLKKSPLDSPLTSSKTYRQLTPPARTNCRVIQRIIFEWGYSPPSGLKSPLTS